MKRTGALTPAAKDAGAELHHKPKVPTHGPTVAVEGVVPPCQGLTNDRCSTPFLLPSPFKSSGYMSTAWREMSAICQ